MASVTELKALTQNMQKRLLPKFCNSKDEFFALYDEDGFMIADRDRHREYHVEIIKPSAIEHSEIIVSMYQKFTWIPTRIVKCWIRSG